VETVKRRKEMSHKRNLFTRLIVVVLILASGILAGCAAKKYVVVEKPKGATLEYRMPEGGALKYEMSQYSDQTMEIMGAAIESNVRKTYTFSVAPKGREGNTYDLEIAIEAMDASITSPQGEFNADVDSVIGRSFSMSVSHLGKELDVSDAEPIHFSVGPQGTRSIMPDFKAFLPDLPANPVNIGDTWTTQDTINIDEGGVEIVIASESVNTLAGFETVAGLECARVTAEVVGTMKGEGEQQGAQISFDGTLSGTETWYFAHEQGLLVESSSDMFVKSNVGVKGPQEMSFPMTQKMSFETTLIK
jgi:hypothetical protein